MTHSIHVIVVGGGYAGVMAANRLTQRDDVAVTLIARSPAFVERLRLHQFGAGSDETVVDYRVVLAPSVRLVVDTVTHIDAPGRSLAVGSGGAVDYDHLVYAVGSTSAASPVPGAAEHAHPLATLEEASRLRAALDATATTAPVVAVGGGSTGIETAAELGEAGRHVTLVCGTELGPYLHPRARRSVKHRLARLGVAVREGSNVAAVSPESLRLSNGSQIPSMVTVWTAGFGVPDLATGSGLSTDGSGRLLTDETLTSVDDARIVAAGDAAAPSDLPFRMSAQTALPLGAHAADTVLSRIAGVTPACIDVGFFGQCISLGRRDAVLQAAHRDDTARGLYLAGRLTAMIKEKAVQGSIKFLTEEARRPGSFTWRFRDPKRQEVLQTAREAVSAGERRMRRGGP